MQSQLFLFEHWVPEPDPEKTMIAKAKVINLTKYQKDIAWLLLQPKHHIKETINVKGKTVFKVFDDGGHPVQYFTERQIEKFSALFKIDNRERITFNLSLVRQLSGHTHLKKLYKKYRSHGK